MPGRAQRHGQRWFRLAMVVKALDGVLELLAAGVLLIVPGATVHRWVAEVLAHDLLGPPDGSLARQFATGADTLTSGSRTFVIVLLIVHGIPKIVLVVALLKRWLPAYPISVLVLGVFVVYQVVRAAHTGSVALIVLTVIDLVVIALIIREYRYLRARRSTNR